jgi:hypothetical protein
MTILEGLDVITGCVRLRGLGYVACSDGSPDLDTPAHSFPIEWDAGTWRHMDDFAELEWVVCGVCVAERDREQGVFVGVNGEVLCVGSGDKHLERIVEIEGVPDPIPPLRGAVGISGDAYAFGTGRQVFRRTGHSQWIHISAAIQPKQGDETLVSFEAMDGYGHGEIYAAGVGGELFRFDGQTWKSISTNTNLILSSICCSGDGFIYVGGQKGILLKGRGDSWETLTFDGMKDEIWGLGWFRDTLFVATLENLYILQKGRDLVPVNFGKKLSPKTFMHLSVRDGVLWSIGNRDIVSFDGKSWAKVL